MEEKDFLISKKKDLLDSFYNMIWVSVRDWQKLVFQNILVLAWVGFLLKFGLEHKKNGYLWITIAISQVTIVWITIVILEAGYWYRVVQMISANIEKTFDCSEIVIADKKKRLIPKEWQTFDKIKLPEIYKIHYTFLRIILWILTLGYFFWNQSDKSFTLKYFGLDKLLILTIGIMGTCLVYWYWYCKRKNNLERLRNSLSL